MDLQCHVCPLSVFSQLLLCGPLCPLLRLIQDRGPGIIMTQTLVSTAYLLNSPSNLCSHTVSVILL